MTAYRRSICAVAARLAAVVVLAVGLVGCGGASSPDGQNAASASDQTVVPEASLVRYDRSGGFVRGDVRSLAITTSGRFDLRLTQGGSRIGQFTGALEPGRLRPLVQAIAELAGSYRSAGPVASESAVEAVDAQGVTATVTSGDDPPKPWSVLLDLLREQTSALTESPRAALELRVASSGSKGALTAELRHVGIEPVRLNAGPATIEVAIFDKSGELRSTWSTTVLVTDTEAAPGWALNLALDQADPPVRATDRYLVSVELVVFDAEGISRPSRLSLARS